MLLDGLIDDSELEAAAVLALRHDGAVDNPWLLAGRVRLAAARGERSSAGLVFRRLCALPEVSLLEASRWRPGYDLDVFAALRSTRSSRPAFSIRVIVPLVLLHSRPRGA